MMGPGFGDGLGEALGCAFVAVFALGGVCAWLGWLAWTFLTHHLVLGWR